MNSSTAASPTVSGYFMGTLRNFISVYLSLVLLTQCNTKKDIDSANKSLLPFDKSQSENLLIGEWKYFNSIWYSSELTLQNNGTFIFHDQGCYGQKISQGQWINKNGIIHLTSFDSFKIKEQTQTFMTSENEKQKKAKRKQKHGEITLSLDSFKDVSPFILPGHNDTVWIYLNNIQLQLRNDTLFCVSSKKLPEGAKFHRTKNNR